MRYTISIIIPTYKEASNIKILCGKIKEALKQADYEYEIVIVDDNSKDGIEQIIESIKSLYNIKLVIRLNDRGLSSAVIEGFKHAKGDIFVVMDADLSHPPEKIVDFADLIVNDNYDFVIGSRFVKGGSVPHFNVFRKANAWISMMMARPFTKVKDPMAGFFAFNSKIIKPGIVLNPLGFKIGLELIVKFRPVRVAEVPILFQERLFGISKLSLREQLNYVIHIKRLFEYKYRILAEFIKFSLIGTSGMFIDLTFVFLSTEALALPFRIARTIGFIFALTSNFFLNRRYTFVNNNKNNFYKQYILFFIVSCMGFIVNWFISVYLYEHITFFSIHYLAASLMGILGGLCINFTGSKFYIFK